MCEDLDHLEGLHHLYNIFKNVFLLNKNALFELMFAEDTIFDVVGCLEFDPGLPTPKRHRQYLRSIAQFHQVWSLTQFCSVDFSKSRIGVKKCVFNKRTNEGLRQLLLTVSWDLRA